MDIGGNSLNFLDLSITINNGNSLVTSVYSKPTPFGCQIVSSYRSHMLGIAKEVALRIRRICSDEDDFRKNVPSMLTI